MVELDWKVKMIEPELNPGNPALAGKPTRNLISPVFPPFSDDPLSEPCSPSDSAAYEHYLRLPELSKLWKSKTFPSWNNESLLKPALQALEITFRFISLILSDPRPYINKPEWTRRLESLTNQELELIASFCEEEGEQPCSTVPIYNVSNGVFLKHSSSQEVWKIPGAAVMVNRTSEQSLLPRLATWKKSETIASKISFLIDSHFQRSLFTLGLGELNLAGKPNLDYDLVCKPNELHSLKNPQRIKNPENPTLYTVHQILETWVFVGQELVSRIYNRIEVKEFEFVAKDCWVLERIWQLLSEIENLILLVDPDDFLRLKNQIPINPSGSGGFFSYLRSRNLIELTRSCKDLKHQLPVVLGVQADPNGGPRLQEAVMDLFHGHERDGFGKIHVLQGFQAIEAAVKRFFFGYQQVVMVVLGSLEGKGSSNVGGSDPLSRIFLDPPGFPSLDGAKTFLGEFWRYGVLNRAPNSSAGSENGAPNCVCAVLTGPLQDKNIQKDPKDTSFQRWKLPNQIE